MDKDGDTLSQMAECSSNKAICRSESIAPIYIYYIFRILSLCLISEGCTITIVYIIMIR